MGFRRAILPATPRMQMGPHQLQFTQSISYLWRAVGKTTWKGMAGKGMAGQISMQKAQTIAGPPQSFSNSKSFKSETRQFTDVSEMTEAYRGRADVRFFQTARGSVTATSRLTSIGPLQIQQFSWTGKLITEAANASNRTTLFIPEPQERPAFISGEHLNNAQVMLYGPHSEHFSDMSGRSRATQLFLPQGMLEASDRGASAKRSDEPGIKTPTSESGACCDAYSAKSDRRADSNH